MTDNTERLLVDMPAHIPGVLFMAISRKIEDAYPKGAMVNTEAGAKRRAQETTLIVLDTLMAFYAEIAEAEGASDVA
jgi:hypothetical protein